MGTFDHRADRVGSDSMKWRKYDGSETLPLWVADMDFPAAEPILDAIRRRVDHGVFGYSLPSAQLLETACAYFLRRYGWRVEPDWIIFSPGLGVALHTVCRMASLQTGNILTPAPIYTVFRHAPAWAGRNRIDVPFIRDGDDWQLSDPSEAAAAVGGADVLMLCNPHNPNGKIFTRSELEQLAEQAAAADWIICSDEVHADLILDSGLEHIPIAGLAPETSSRTITLQSPSKAFNLAGLNCATVVIEDPALRDRYRKAARGQVIDQLNPLGMAACEAAWNGSADSWLSELLECLRANRDRVAAAAAAVEGITMPQLASTYLAWLDVSGLGLAYPPAHFEAHGLGMSSGSLYGDSNYMRLNFGTDAAIVAEACSRLRAAAQAA